MEVIFYITGSKNNEMNKALFSEEEFNCRVYDPTQVVNPTLIVNASKLDFNYAYIDEFKRYYFITSQRVLDGNRIEVSLKVDVLMSYKSTIEASILHLERSTSNGNYYFTDEATPILSTRKQFVRNLQGGSGTINSSSISDGTRNIIVTVAGQPYADV